MGDSTTFAIIGLGTVALYAISYALAHIKKLHIATHRKIWNAVLAITFVGVGLTGIVRMFTMYFGLPLKMPFDIVFVHDITGLAFTIIAIFHIAWHIPYFKSYLPKTEPKKTEEGNQPKL